MTRFLAACVLLVLSGFAGAKEGWTEDFAKAQAKARAEKKKVLLDFTGSDWCGWCIRLDREVFSQREFKQYAAKNLVLVEVDFPEGKRQSRAVKQQNVLLAKKYGVESFPTIVVLGPDGRKRGELGYVAGGPKAFIRKLEKVR